MVGYNDAYNRAITAKSNALQRRKGQMIDRLNGSGRGGEDDYLSEGSDDEGMEGGGAYYEDDYEGEMFGGGYSGGAIEDSYALGTPDAMEGGADLEGSSFAEASREVGSGRRRRKMKGGFLPMLLPALAPILGGLVGKLFGGGYSGGASKEELHSAMMADAKKLAQSHAKMEGSGLSGGNPMLGMLLPALAPVLGGLVGKLFGGGYSGGNKEGMAMKDAEATLRQMEGSGFFGDIWDGIKGAVGMVAPALAPIAGKMLASKLGGRRRCGSGVSGGRQLIGLANPALYPKPNVGGGYSGGKQSPYDLAYGGSKQSAQSFFDADSARLGAEAHGMKTAGQIRKEANYALGAGKSGGKRLYMRGGQAPVAPMGAESLYGYDNNYQGQGLIPPRNVATRGYIQGGSHGLIPRDQLPSGIGGAKRSSPWISHVKAYQSKHGCSYKEALSRAGASYRSSSGSGDAY
nr:MAG: hypothetical protein [Lake Baikal virophage 6]